MNAKTAVTFLLLASVASVSACKKKTAPTNDDLLVTPTATTAPVPRETMNEILANFSKVHFDFDSAVLGASSQSVLKRNAEILGQHQGIVLEIQGHADERGTTDYNLALGHKRAEAVRKFLVAQGVTTSRIKTVSYGEERPAVAGSDEVAWAQNRRAEFRVISGTGVAGTVN